MEDSVYEPREDSYLIQKYVEIYCKKDFLVLDMGTGSGIQAITAAKVAKKVVAVDINPDAVKYAKEAASIDKINNILVIESDLFEKVPKEKFDLIIFNPPYLPEEKELEDKALFSAKRGTETTVRFLNEVNSFLKREGLVLFTGSSLASKSILDKAIEDNIFTCEFLEKIHVFFEDVFVMKLEKLPLLKKLENMKISDSRLFARGKRGIIIKGVYEGKDIAVKVKRDESTAMGSIRNEGSFLEKLNKLGIGPMLVFKEEDMLGYWFVEGEFIEEFIEKSKKPAVIKVLKSVFEQCRKLDELGINKFEMHHPTKHILIGEDNKPVLIDFERARHTEYPKNVTQFCDYIISDNMINMLREKGIQIDREIMIKLAREYKKGLELKNYKNIIELLK